MSTHPFADPFPQLIPKRGRHVLQRLKSRIWSTSGSVEVEGAAVGRLPVSVEAVDQLEFFRMKPGELFGGPGGSWEQRWFRCRIPAAKEAERGQRHLFWECQGEGTAYWKGEPWAGLDVAHPSCPLPDDGGVLHIDQGSYQTAEWPGRPPLQAEYGCRFDGAVVKVRETGAWDAYWDLASMLEFLDHLLVGEGYPASGKTIGWLPPHQAAAPLLRFILAELNALFDCYDRGEWRAFTTGLTELFRRCPAGAHQGVAALIGHAHLDMVWLWPEEVGIRKGIHTFATVQRLLDQYPEWVFNQSSPYLYQKIARREPGLFRSISRHIFSGRIEATGGFYLESDLNLPSGEALARGLLHGQRLFQELRGEPSRLAWLPDVFGFPGFLPQLLQQAGIRYFFSSKMRWSAIETFPHTSFRWIGDDGTELLAHQCPAGYGGIVSVRATQRSVRENRQGGVFPEVLLGQGLSDGGGGPTEEMLERARRYKNLTGMPQTEWSTGEAFFARMAHCRAELPAYQGEMYVQKHRGVFTTHGRFKQLYRDCEKILAQREALHVLLGLPALSLADWERLLFAQFHDALPGSAIGLVYQELESQLKSDRNVHRAWIEEQLGDVGAAATLFNPHLLPWRGVIQHPTQPELHYVDVPALCIFNIDTKRSNPPEVEWVAEIDRLSNGRVDLRFNQTGEPERLWVDGEDRLLELGRLILYPDHPADFDAWEIDHQTLALGRAVQTISHRKTARIRDGEGRIVRVEWTAQVAIGSGSTGTLRYYLDAGSPFLMVELAVDWHETHRLLKYSVQTGYRSRQIRCGAGFGSTCRSIRPGRPAEDAEWEVPAQRWAALTHDDGSGGLTIVTEAKYGFSAVHGSLGLSLLRAPTYPDPGADQGRHEIRFAIGPFYATTTAGYPNPAVAAELLYAPPRLGSHAETDGPGGLFLRIDDWGSVSPSTVKPAENGSGFVLRLHETMGRPGTITLRYGHPEAAFQKVNVLEEPADEIFLESSLDATGSSLKLSYRAYEIISLRIGQVQP